MNATFTDDRQALLNAIIAKPEDDAPRLAYADWLDEHDQPERAEFIRVEVERAHTGLIRCVEPHKPSLFGCGKCNFCKLEIKSEDCHCTQEIWREIANGLENTFGGYAHTSRDPVHGNGFPETWPCVFTRRGFVDEIHCTLADWMQHGPAIVTKHPVTRVTLTDREPRKLPIVLSRWLELNLDRDGNVRKDRQQSLDDLSQACIAWAKSVTPS